MGMVYILDNSMRSIEVVELWISEVGGSIVFMVTWWYKIRIFKGNHAWMTLVAMVITVMREQISSR